MGKNRRRKAGKRAYLKRFSAAMVSTGKGPDPGAGYINDQGQLVDMTLGSRSRAAKTGVPDPWLDSLFPGVNSYTTDKVVAATLRGPLANPRQLVLGRLWQGDQRQGLEKFKEIKLIMGKRNKLSLMLGFKECFFIEEIHKSTGTTLKRSIMYSSKDNALCAERCNQICWVELKTIQNST